MGCSLDLLKETNSFAIVCNKIINGDVTKKT